MSTEQLHARAWEIVAPLIDRDCETAKARYLAVADTPTGTSDVKRAIRAAHQGRDRHTVRRRRRASVGHVGRDHRSHLYHDRPELGDIDLLDAAAAQAWLHGGTVYAVPPDEVPGGRQLAAVLRY